MDPVVTIPLSEYTELKAFKEKNQIKIYFYDSHFSIQERQFKVTYEYPVDQELPMQLRDQLNFKIKSIEQIITEQRSEAKLLAEEREKTQRVPKWILRIFNRKAN